MNQLTMNLEKLGEWGRVSGLPKIFGKKGPNPTVEIGSKRECTTISGPLVAYHTTLRELQRSQ